MSGVVVGQLRTLTSKQTWYTLLYQVQKFGNMPIEKFADLLKPGEKKRCLQNRVSKKWYTIPQEVFISFIFRVRGLHSETVRIHLHSS